MFEWDLIGSKVKEHDREGEIEILDTNFSVEKSFLVYGVIAWRLSGHLTEHVMFSDVF
jgi:hypothetical protein